MTNIQLLSHPDVPNIHDHSKSKNGRCDGSISSYCFFKHFHYCTHFKHTRIDLRRSTKMTRIPMTKPPLPDLPLSANVFLQNQTPKNEFYFREGPKSNMSSSCRPMWSFSFNCFSHFLLHSSSLSSFLAASHPKAHLLVIPFEKRSSLRLVMFAAVLLFAVIAQPVFAAASSSTDLPYFSDRLNRGT